jgi:hypothetical protein
MRKEKSLQADLSSDRLSTTRGPLLQVAGHLGLIGRSGSSVPAGLAIGAGLWLVLVLLAHFEGAGHRLWTLEAIAGHVRLLLVIPLLFLAESMFEPRVRDWIAMLLRYRIVPEAEQSRFERTAAWFDRRRHSRVAELLALTVAAALSIPGVFTVQFGATAAFDPARADAAFSLAGAWYWFVALTVFRFLVVRWLWHLGLWWLLLWRISRLQLRLIATHPDRAGGLGFVEVVQSQLLPLVVAISALQAAALSESVVTGMGGLEILAPTMLVTLVVELLLMIGPTFLFGRTLWTHRVEALRKYMGLASLFVDRFHHTWAEHQGVANDDLVNTGQWSSLTDMGASVSVVREMRLIPVSPRFLVQIAIAGIAPALPLLLLKYPVSDLAANVVSQILGI